MATRLRSSTRGAAMVANESIAATLATPRKSSASSKSALVAPYDKPIVGDDLNKLGKMATVAFITAVLFLAGIYMLITHKMLQLHPKQMSPESFRGYAVKAEYALRYQLLLIFWLTLNVFVVIYQRLSSGAINPLTQSTEHVVQAGKSVLTNSFEQAFISIFAQLIFVGYADNTTVLTFIPAINIVQFFGRITFFAGYPLYRTFGFTLTILPNVAMVSYNMYRFGNFINLY